MANYFTIEQDITTMDVDCIVNAANEKMLGGGGVDGAIHTAAGPRLLGACWTFPIIKGQSQEIRCPTGHVRITPAFKLPCQFVIHTVGPIWEGGNNNEAELLASCYRRSLQLAALHGSSVAIPAISTGAFRFPITQACEIAIREIEKFMQVDSESLKKIFLVTYKSEAVSKCFSEFGVPPFQG